MAKPFVIQILLLISVFSPLALSQCKLVKYASHENYPPFHWSYQGEFYGITHDITKKLLTKYGVAHKVETAMPWKRVLLNAQRTKIDLVLGLKHVPERESYLAFTQTELLENPVAVFVKVGKEFEFASWESLVGLAGTLNSGDRHGEEFDRFVSSQLTTERVYGLGANFGMLLRDRSDYFVTGYYSGMNFLKANHLDSKIVPLMPNVSQGFIHFGFVKKSPCLGILRKFDQDLADMKGSEEFKEIMDRNIQLWYQQIK